MSTLAKTRKQIAKKRNGAIDALHRFSRDSKRLHKASIRDDRLEKLASARSKKEQPLLDRVAYFQESLRRGGNKPLEMEAVQKIIAGFVHQYDEELATMKKARRSGRPPSAKEDLLKVKIANLEEEYKIGFLVPDLGTQENIDILDRFEGSWSYLSRISWLRISSAGKSRPSGFPAGGVP